MAVDVTVAEAVVVVVFVAEAVTVADAVVVAVAEPVFEPLTVAEGGLGEGVADTVLVIERVAETVLVIERVAEAILVTERVAAAVLVTERVAEAILVTERVADTVLVIERVAEAVLVTERVLVAERVVATALIIMVMHEAGTAPGVQPVRASKACQPSAQRKQSWYPPVNSDVHSVTSPRSGPMHPTAHAGWHPSA